MDVATITMDPADARQRYDEYRASLAGLEPTDEDRGILLGYKALASGRAVLDLFDVFRACPLDERHRPRLAVGRAHWRWCRCDANSRGLVFYESMRAAYRRGPDGRSRVRIPDGSYPADVRKAPSMRAMVPIIPPNLRPRADLSNYLILWEAEWVAVPTDPMLLRHVHGSLYAVLAVWDLTPLERSVLAGRLAEARP